MAELKVKTYIEVADANEIRRFGSDSSFISIPMDGGGKVHYNRFDGVDTSSDPQLLYDSTNSPIPSGAKIYFVRADTDGKVLLDNGSAGGSTSSIPIKANVWMSIGGPEFHVISAETDATGRADNSTTQIDRIYYEADSGTDADVEILGVS